MTCERCGQTLQVGDWPFCPHGTSVQLQPFAAYFDHGLGQEVTSLGDRWAAMKRLNLQYKDHPPKGQLSARIDRIHQEKAARKRL